MQLRPSSRGPRSGRRSSRLRAEGAGIIVIGSHGRSGVRYAALGSVATAVAHHATVPVLIARNEDSDSDLPAA